MSYIYPGLYAMQTLHLLLRSRAQERFNLTLPPAIPTLAPSVDLVPSHIDVHLHDACCSVRYKGLRGMVDVCVPCM